MNIAKKKRLKNIRMLMAIMVMHIKNNKYLYENMPS